MWLYWSITWLLTLVITSEVITGLEAPATTFIQVLAWLTYGWIYLLPALVISSAVARLAPAWIKCHIAVAVVSAWLVQLALFADLSVFRIFGFHLNGFVWNLATTPGGIESMGASFSTEFTYALLVIGLLAMQAGFVWVARFATEPGRKISLATPSRKTAWVCVGVLLLCGVSERIHYGVAHARGNATTLNAVNRLPLYMPLTFGHMARRLGFDTVRRPGGYAVDDVDPSLDVLNYPLEPIQAVNSMNRYNIVWLVSESLRGDMLNPEIMPNLWRFSQRGARFTDHISGGNGTRMGMFSMFYGLPGTYWQTFLDNRRSPVLLDALQAANYDMLAQTSAHFSYPEFDRTVFSGLPLSALHEDADEPRRWLRDERNVERGLAWMTTRTQPFFYFQFFEAPHASYYFPERSVIRPDYEADLNYAALDISDIEPIKNRYINAVHFLDDQIGLVVRGLEQAGLSDSTIIIVTGDHGEAFMEHGRWGHNSDFTDEQIHVPLVIAGPGVEPSVTEHMTSHLDLPATLFGLLDMGLKSDMYSLGRDLFGGDQREYAVVSDWHGAVLISQYYKILLAGSFKSSGLAQVTTRDDRSSTEPDRAFQAELANLNRVLAGMSRFRSTSQVGSTHKSSQAY